MPTIQRTGVLYTTTYKQRWHQAWTRGADPQKCRLAPPHCETYRRRIRWVFEIFKFWSLLQSKSVNNVCELLQLLGDQTTHRTSLGDFRIDPLDYIAKWKLPGAYVTYRDTVTEARVGRRAGANRLKSVVCSVDFCVYAVC